MCTKLVSFARLYGDARSTEHKKTLTHYIRRLECICLSRVTGSNAQALSLKCHSMGRGGRGKMLLKR